MEIAMLAIKPVLTKLGDLLVGEFTLEKRARKGIESLMKELTLMHAALDKVAKLPAEKLDKGVKIWAGMVKELSYQMEDIIDAFMVRVEDEDEPAYPKNKVKKLLKKTIQLFKKGKELHRISDALKEVVGQAKELAELRKRYLLEMRDTVDARTSVDPRVMSLYNTEETELVGIEETRDELINMLTVGDDLSKHPLKTVSIVGFGGLGKTTLAKIAYDKIKGQFDCCAFVSVSQNPDTQKVLKNILYELDKHKYGHILNVKREEKHLIDELIEFLTNKRYLIVIDDIWDKEAWKLINCAFSKKSPGSRLITTTRIVGVSEACCSSSDDIYRMKPLSHDVSRRLFHKRVFSDEKECPLELVQVSEDILKKCGGIPLAIITIASLLAGSHQIKTNEQWYDLLNSIGRGLTEDRSVEEMKRILLFSYYDLPSYLKPCLLYLSIYPEDHKIMRAKLVWKWISEGLVYSEKETSLYELGDSYFSELVNRSMIQPIGIDDEEKVEACRVHDMVLDLICSLANEENFITIFDGTKRKMPNSQSNVRRLSVQNSKMDVATISMAHVRSLTVFSNGDVDPLQKKSSFQVLRVLDLEHCPISDTTYVGNLLHLRYIGLKYNGVKELPEEIGKLRLLQTLDISGTSIRELPSSVVELRRLMCLCINKDMKLPSGIGNLTSLEVVVGLMVAGNFNHHLVKELGHLTMLRLLQFKWGHGLDESMHKDLVESLNNLHKLESLDCIIEPYVDLMSEGWVPCLQLRRLSLSSHHTMFRTLPRWINHSSLRVLSYLRISTWDGVRSEDIQAVGMMPALRYVEFCADDRFSAEDLVEMSVVTPDSFPCMTECIFSRIAVVPATFPRGAAPRLKRVHFTFPARWISRVDFDLGMGHLPSLDHVDVTILERGATNTEVKEARAAVMAAVDDLPHCSNLCINGNVNYTPRRVHKVLLPSGDYAFAMEASSSIFFDPNVIEGGRI